jgi:hypothetical protein
MPIILDLCFAQLVRPFLASTEVLFMNAMPPAVLFGVVGALLIVALYFVWGRKLGKS